MPTIEQLPAAAPVSPVDALPVSQGGHVRAMRVGDLLAGAQPVVAVAPGRLLGRVAATAGGPEAVTALREKYGGQHAGALKTTLERPIPRPA